MEKGNVVYTYIQRILFKRKEIKKEGNSHTCYTMDDKDIMLGEII